MRAITLETARRLFIARLRLNKPHSEVLPNTSETLLDVIRDLGCLQLDPISAVARSHQLVMWSRVGNYDVAALDQLLWQDRSLFEYWAHMASIVLTEDYPIRQLFMRTYAREEATGKISQRYQLWLTANQRLKRHILQELKRHGPLPARVFENKTEAGNGWYSTGCSSSAMMRSSVVLPQTASEVMSTSAAGRACTRPCRDNHQGEFNAQAFQGTAASSGSELGRGWQ